MNFRIANLLEEPNAPGQDVVAVVIVVEVLELVSVLEDVEAESSIYPLASQAIVRKYRFS